MGKKVSIQATLRGVPKGVEFIPRSQVRYRYRYTLQTQSLSGSWSASISTDDWDTVVSQAEHAMKIPRGGKCRIVDNGDPDKETGA